MAQIYVIFIVLGACLLCGISTFPSVIQVDNKQGLDTNGLKNIKEEQVTGVRRDKPERNDEEDNEEDGDDEDGDDGDEDDDNDGDEEDDDGDIDEVIFIFIIYILYKNKHIF